MTEAGSETAVVVGSQGGIAAAVIAALAASGRYNVHAIGRTASGSDARYWQTDYTASSLAEVAASITDTSGELSRLIICNGVLHGDGFGPERALRQIDAEAMLRVLEINTVIPMLVLSAFQSMIKRAASPRIAVLSARVGSISDNRLGGWYSYRGSKAALNMMLKNAAIEMGRFNRGAKLVAFHPGTTDTPLSKPFQKGVPEDKLFTPEFVAERLLGILDTVEADGALSYLDWAGESIEW